MKLFGYSFCRKERIDRKVGIERFYALCALCVLCGLIAPLGAEQVADLSRDGVGLVVDASPRGVDLGRDFYVTITLTAPSGVTASLPDLRDRFQGFRVAEDFAEEPATDKDGRTTSVTRWRLEPDPLARRYRLAPFAVQVGDGTFATAPVLFDPPAAREPAAGDLEINPTRDLPPFSWKLVGICAAALAGLLLVDTADSKVRAAFAEAARKEVEERDRFFARNGIDNVPVATDKPYIQAIRALFKRRASKR